MDEQEPLPPTAVPDQPGMAAQPSATTTPAPGIRNVAADGVPPAPVPRQVSRHIVLKTAVRLVAAGIIAYTAYNAYVYLRNWQAMSSDGLAMWFNIAEIIFTFAMAVGVLLLRDTARAAYVFLSALILLLTAADFYQLYAPASYPLQHVLAGNGSMQSQVREILSYNNPTLEAASKQSSVQLVSAQASKQAPGLSHAYFPFAVVAVTTLLPFVFLSISTVKNVFRL